MLTQCTVTKFRTKTFNGAMYYYFKLQYYF